MKRCLALICLAISACCWLPGAEVAVWLKEAAAADQALDSRRALEFLLQANEAKPNDALILQKIAKQYSDLVVEQTNLAEKKRYTQIALDYAQRSVDLNPKDPVSVLSLAVCYGKLAVFSDTRTKVKYSRLVREAAERALTFDPNYAWAHHVLGRWHYEVAELSGASRFFVKLLYGGLPEASIATAVKELQRATTLEPTELNHWLELGFAYAAAGEKKSAKISWERGLAMPSRAKHDESTKSRARDALAALK